jgi:hypothetical protein
MSVNEYKQKVHLIDYLRQQIVKLLESTCSARKRRGRDRMVVGFITTYS